MYTYDELKQFVEQCTRCPLCRTRNRSVMGKGDLHSEILFIAEAPGRNEDDAGIPFVGKSGELFDRMLDKIGMSSTGKPGPETGGKGTLYALFEV